MPLEELPAAVRKTGCKALVLSGVIEPKENVIKEQLPRLVGELSIPVFVGGPVTATSFDVLKKSGVQLIGSDIETALRQISKSLK